MELCSKLFTKINEPKSRLCHLVPLNWWQVHGPSLRIKDRPSLISCKTERFKVYMTDFFLFARLNLPNVLISVAKKFFRSDFPSPCFDVPKASIFTSSGVQNRDTKNRRLGTIVMSIQDSKPREKQISQSFS